MHSMNYLGKFISNFRYVYNEINAATLTGAIDVVVVEQPDGSYTCSPFHVRFGKIGVLRSREKVVDIEINGEPVDIHMKLGESGEAFFVEEVPPGEEGEEEFIPPHLACSPIPIDSSFPERFLAERAKNDQWNGFDVRGPLSSGVQRAEREEDEDDEDGDEEKPVVVLAGNMPKTFRAETVESADKKEMVRKLSTVSGDFRPIAGSISGGSGISGRRDSADIGLASQQSHSTTDLTLDESPVSERVSSSLPGNKRKRRKKSLMKKKNNNNSNNINNNNNSSGANSVSIVKKLSTSEPANIQDNNASQLPDSESIFQIEDIEQSGHSNLMDNDSNSSTSKDELSRIQNAPVENDLHFFSDTEITPGCSPHDARQFTPVQSDTEFETKRMLTSADNDECKGSEEPPQQSWRWGELPTSNHEDSGKQDDPHRSMLHNMLGFMKKTKHIRHNRDNEGIYLSDINFDELDPEVAALYFPTSYKQQVQQRSNNTGGGSGSGNDEDAESGNGPSLPQSPHSVEGAIGGPKSLDSDFEELKHGIYHNKEIAMSLCGNLDRPEGPSEQLFQERLVHYDCFIENPGILENPELVVRIDGKMYRWRAACSIIMSQLVYNKSLPQEVISRLSEASPTRQEKRKGQRRGYTSWFTWGVRTADSGVAVGKESVGKDGSVEPATVESTEAGAVDKSQPISTEASPKTENEATPEVTEVPQETGSNVTLTVSQETESATVEISTTSESATGPVSNDIPIHNSSPMSQTVPRSAKSLAGEHIYSTSSDSESEFDHGQRHSKVPGLSIPLDRTHRSSDKYRKTLRLSSDLIAKLNLREGANEVEFSVTTAYQGTSRCKCFLFKWRYDDKIVISDIDGTITKSDVLGHILPIVGKDWAQSGVAKLFTKIKNNGYKLLYLSARAIGQSRLTRDYLKSIKQEDLSLPEGPILLNPTSLLTAFHTEVIEKKPEEFKISCLRDIQALFPTNANPFYAGYGNKINDVWAYQAVGIPIFRIFTINHRGELKHELTQTFQSSYSGQSCIVNDLFPPQFLVA